MRARNATYQWASYIISTLHRCGIEHFVISPGSRSTPLTMAAAAQQSLKKHVVLDERSAGFVALGIGKKTGFPAVLICTSGTAAANYYPAVIEAGKSAVPLIVLSADRPPELHGTGANQTINQERLFGSYARFYDTGEVKSNIQNIRSLTSEISSMVLQAIKQRNPLQINVPLAKPLEPTRSFYTNFEIDEQIVGEIETKSSIPKILKEEEPDLLGEISDHISRAKRPIIIAGYHQHFDISNTLFNEITESFNAPVLAESTSQLALSKNKHFINGFNTYLRSEAVRQNLAPDLIISMGDAWIGRGLLQYFEEHKNCFHIHVTSSGLPQNPSQSVNHTLDAANLDSVTVNKHENTNPEWLPAWQRLSAAYEVQTQSALANEHTFTDLHVFNTLLPAIPEHYHIFCGNSLPIRDLDRFTGIYNMINPLFANRGASGIDGNISSAVGIGMASDSPVIAIIGDLTFLHDSNALLSKRLINKPFIVVIINNGGGSIFDMLPVTEFRELMGPYFTTPQDADISALAKVHELPYHAVEDMETLQKAFKSAQHHNGISLVECKTDAGSSMRIRNNLWQHHWHDYID